MKRLYLLRHAKSSWSDASLDDFDRPLNGRGQRAAPAMARWFVETQPRPDLIIASPAIRAWETACCFADMLGMRDALREEHRIYEASCRELQGVVCELPTEAATVLLVGHNPGFTELAGWLVGGGVQHMPTCALYGVVLPVDEWMGTYAGVGQADVFMTPRMLEGGHHAT